MSDYSKDEESKETNKADWFIFNATNVMPAGRYDKDSQTLELIFRDNLVTHFVLKYNYVPIELWNDLCNAKYRVEFYEKSIRKKYKSTGPLDENGKPITPYFGDGIKIQRNEWGKYWFESPSQYEARTAKYTQYNQPTSKSGCSFLFWIIIASWIIGSLFTIKAIITGHY